MIKLILLFTVLCFFSDICAALEKCSERCEARPVVEGGFPKDDVVPAQLKNISPREMIKVLEKQREIIKVLKKQSDDALEIIDEQNRHIKALENKLTEAGIALE